MTSEDKSQIPLFSTEDERESPKNSDQLRENGTPNIAHKWTGFQGKTLWDWLQLLGFLAIPLVVACATIFFGVQQSNLANQQHENDQKIANQQHIDDQQSALDQQEATLLQAYLDNVQDLLLNHQLATKPTIEVRELARARTLATLRSLDPYRKGILLLFLDEANLIEKGNAKIDLRFADFSGAKIPGIDLHSTDLHGIGLRNADLRSVDLSNTNLSFADFRGADFLDINLRGADLTGAQIIQQQINQVETCKGATLPLGLTCHHNQ